MKITKAIANFEGKNEGEIKGFVSFEQIDRKHCRVTFNLSGFKPNKTHAIHIHEFGDLRKGCDSLGGHYNPYKENHGSLHSKQRHVGDLINNLTSDENGNFLYSYIDDSIKIDSKKVNILGRSVVIHDGIDDLGLGGLNKQGQVINEKLHKTSLENGNAGGRIACAIIGIAK